MKLKTIMTITIYICFMLLFWGTFQKLGGFIYNKHNKNKHSIVIKLPQIEKTINENNYNKTSFEFIYLSDLQNLSKQENPAKVQFDLSDKKIQTVGRIIKFVEFPTFEESSFGIEIQHLGSEPIICTFNNEKEILKLKKNDFITINGIVKFVMGEIRLYECDLQHKIER